MDEILLDEARALAASLDDEAEAAALLEMFAIASEAPFDPGDDEVYTPFVYPH